MAARELLRQPDPGLELAGEMIVKGTSGSGDASPIIPLSVSDFAGLGALSAGAGGVGGTTTPSTLELLQTGPVNITDRYAAEVQKYEDLKAYYLQQAEEFGGTSYYAIVSRMDMDDQEKVVAQIAKDNGFVGYPDGIVTAEAQIEAAQNQTIVGNLANSLYNAATSVPVVGGFLGDVATEVGGFLDDSDIKIVASPTGITATATARGSSRSGITSGMPQVPFNPVFTTTAGPGATITGGISSGNKIFDRVVQVLRGQGVTEEAIKDAAGAILGDILKGTPEGVIAATIYDLVKDVLKKDSETTTTTTTTTTTQSETEGTTEGAGAVSEEKKAAIDAAREAISAGNIDGARRILVTAGISLKDIEEFLKSDSDDTTTTTTTTICPPGTDLADKPAPDGDLTKCNDTSVPICPPGTDLADKPAPDGDLTKCNDTSVPICPPGTDLADKPAPDGDLTKCNDTSVPICPPGTDLADQPAPDGDLTKCDIDEPPVICPEGTDLAGQAAPDGDLTKCTTSGGAICPEGTDLAGEAAPDGDLTKCTIDNIECPQGQTRNPETGECGYWTTEPCDNPVFAYFNPEICGGTGVSGMGMPSGSSRGVRVTGPELTQIDYLYDIGGEGIFNPKMTGQSPLYTAKGGGMIDTYSEFDELIELLRG